MLVEGYGYVEKKALNGEGKMDGGRRSDIEAKAWLSRSDIYSFAYPRRHRYTRLEYLYACDHIPRSGGPYTSDTGLSWATHSMYVD